MLNALYVSVTGANPEGVRRASGSMQQQGFVPGPRLDWNGGAMVTWASPSQLEVENLELQTPLGNAYCVGPLWYGGKFGKAALGSLIEDSSAGRQVDEASLRGNFVLFLRTAHQCLVLNDGLGFVRLYTSPDGLFHSSSWLATCAYAGRVGLNAAAAVEYVLLGASHSDETVAEGVTTLPLGSGLDLTRNVRYDRTRLWDSGVAAIPATLDAAVEQLAAHLATVFAETTAAFPSHTRAAISGGFDSRLILAGLLASGNRPELFVYGKETSGDVSIARSVAGSVDIPLDVIDKSTLDAQLAPPNLERLVASSLFFDGLPNDGVYDSGVDQQTRLEQTAGGRLGLNGGGGEIFRNYFHLPDRRFSAMDIVRAFYRGFDRRVLRQPGALSTYENRMATAIACAVGVSSDNLTQPIERSRIELAYPLFRCHHWMAVNNSVAVRHGYYMTPLADPVAVALAWRLPLVWKDVGLLEARLIDALHSGVARQMSEYGFRFSDGPHARMRFQAWMSSSRPVFARPFINAAGRYLRRRAVAPTLLAYCRAVLPGEWCMDRLLDLQRLPGNQALARALAVEVAWRKLLL
jgi:hypothetical protein